MDANGNFTNLSEFTESGPSIGSFVLRNQVGVMLRTAYLLDSENAFSIDRVVAALAVAEKDSGFLCGFADLRRVPEYVRSLGEYLIQEGYVTDDGAMTAKGSERAESLPEPIETYILNGQRGEQE